MILGRGKVKKKCNQVKVPLAPVVVLQQQDLTLLLNTLRHTYMCSTVLVVFSGAHHQCSC